MSKLYLAYGSNLSKEQMAMRCPNAKIIGSTLLTNYRLMFRGHPRNAFATVEKKEGASVPVLVWELTPLDEASLDTYEGCPIHYRKEIHTVSLNGKRISAMIYIMNEIDNPYGCPSMSYLRTIADGYKAFGFDDRILQQAYIKSIEAFRGGDTL